MLYRLAIVEDNATARANLRSHLVGMGLFDVSSFSNGSELKAALRKQTYEIVIFDYHLGQKRNGVEWVIQLQKSNYIKPSTGIIFVTSDRSAQTIGQIIDIHPDLLIIKPYTIASLTRSITQYLNFRHTVEGVLADLDQRNTARALREIEKIILNGANKRIGADLNKLHAKVLLKGGHFPQARRVYEQTLANSEKVLWAQWGKIKCHYLEGKFDECKVHLTRLVKGSLSRDKAFEWLASLSFQESAYSQAEFYLDHIQDSELSLPAAKLKSVAYKKQNRLLEGIELLQKKREYNRSAKEKFDEFTYELAEFYLSIAEQSPVQQRTESLSQARKLIGIAGRNQNDLQSKQKHDFMLAYSAVLESDLEKARTIVSQEHMNNTLRADSPTLVSAAKIWKHLGDTDKANDLLNSARERLEEFNTISEQVSHTQDLKESEQSLGLADERALSLNDAGTRLYVAKNYVKAMPLFFEAFDLMPQTAAFGLNLLNCLIDAKTHTYRTTTVAVLMNHLESLELQGSHLERFKQLHSQIMRATELFLPPKIDFTQVIPNESVN